VSQTAPVVAGAAGHLAGRTFVILNPAAGHEDYQRLRRLIGGAFAARLAPFDMVETAGPGDAERLAREAADLGFRAVCVVGGDGTLAEAATALCGTDTPLAVIPRGTANQVAQNLRIPIDLEAAVEVVVNGVARPIDLGRIDGRAFLLVAGAGFDAAIMASATRELKERWGFGAYVFAAVKEALAMTPVRFRLCIDGRDLEIDAVTIMVANVGKLFSGFLPFRFPLGPSRTGSWDDGLFDVVALAPRRFPELAPILWRAARRRFDGDERLIHFQASEVTIDADPPIAVQVDGDAAGETPVTARVAPSALRFLVPTA
jgi:YegS/Rv2252/BmrU family lipid kinase